MADFVEVGFDVTLQYPVLPTRLRMIFQHNAAYCILGRTERAASEAIPVCCLFPDRFQAYFPDVLHCPVVHRRDSQGPKSVRTSRLRNVEAFDWRRSLFANIKIQQGLYRFHLIAGGAPYLIVDTWSLPPFISTNSSHRKCTCFPGLRELYLQFLYSSLTFIIVHLSNLDLYRISTRIYLTPVHV